MGVHAERHLRLRPSAPQHRRCQAFTTGLHYMAGGGGQSHQHHDLKGSTPCAQYGVSLPGKPKSCTLSPSGKMRPLVAVNPSPCKLAIHQKCLLWTMFCVALGFAHAMAIKQIILVLAIAY